VGGGLAKSMAAKPKLVFSQQQMANSAVVHYNEKRLLGRLRSCQPFRFWKNVSRYGPGL